MKITALIPRLAAALFCLLTLSACVTVTETEQRYAAEKPPQAREMASPPLPLKRPVHTPLGAQGQSEAMVQIMVEEDGQVGDRVLLKSTGSSQLDQAALAAVGDWEFQPALDVEGAPMAMQMVVQVRFR